MPKLCTSLVALIRREWLGDKTDNNVDMNINTPESASVTVHTGITKTRKTWGLAFAALGIILAVESLLGSFNIAKITLDTYSTIGDFGNRLYTILSIIISAIGTLAFVISGILTLIYLVKYTDVEKPSLLKTGAIITGVGFVARLATNLLGLYNLKFVLGYVNIIQNDNAWQMTNQLMYTVVFLGFVITIVLAIKNIGPNMKLKSGDVFVPTLVFLLLFCLVSVYGAVNNITSALEYGIVRRSFYLRAVLNSIKSITFIFCLIYPISFLLPNLNKSGG